MQCCRPNHQVPFARSPFRSAISMAEILIVFAVIALLLAMLVPGLARAKEQMRRTQCKNNLRHWGIALQMYRDENFDYLPTEGTYLHPTKPYTWFNVLPPYLDAPSYKDVERISNQEDLTKQLREFPSLHVWICPGKNLSRLNMSTSRLNQFHYGMNEVLDGMNSAHIPEFPDQGETPIRGTIFTKPAATVFLFDIYRNDSRGNQGDVGATFHRGTGNVLFLDASVDGFLAEHFVKDGNFADPDFIWTHPRLYWGYTPKNKP